MTVSVSFEVAEEDTRRFGFEFCGFCLAPEPVEGRPFPPAAA